MNNYIYLIIFLLLASLCFPQQKKFVAITIDDLPTSYSGNLDTTAQSKYFIDILSTLRNHKIKSFGFVVGNSVTQQNRYLIEMFKQEGHTIGNHTFTHRDLNNLSAKDYIKDIERCDSVIKDLSGEKKYFRYSYLHRGNTREKRDSVYEYFNNNGYTIVPVTIDNDEWIFNRDYVNSIVKNDFEKAKNIGKEYVKYMADISEHFDSIAVYKTGRQIKHILLIHLNLINGDYLEELINWYKSNNWEIISAEEALKDPIYKEEDIYVGERGISFLERIK